MQNLAGRSRFTEFLHEGRRNLVHVFGFTLFKTEKHNQLTTISLMLPIIPVGTIAYPFTLLKVNHRQL